MRLDTRNSSGNSSRDVYGELKAKIAEHNRRAEESRQRLNRINRAREILLKPKVPRLLPLKSPSS